MREKHGVEEAGQDLRRRPPEHRVHIDPRPHSQDPEEARKWGQVRRTWPPGAKPPPPAERKETAVLKGPARRASS